MKTHKPRAFGLCALLLLALPAPPAAARQKKDGGPSVTVTGRAELRVQPDEAVFYLEVARIDKDLSAAQQQADESVRQILAIARRAGVAEQNVKTDFISVGMRYSTDYADEDGDEDKPKKVKREFVGYAVSKTVVVRLTDISRFEQFFSEVLKAGVSNLRNVDYRTSQIRKYKDQARAMAVRAAREKATAMAAELGQSVGKAYSIEEEDPDNGRSAMSNSTGFVAGNFSASETESAFAPGTITVTAQVTISFVLN
jgi:hypothetical protein